MSVSWQRVRVPLLERLLLAELAERRGESEEATLTEIIREAAIQEALRPVCQVPELGAHKKQEVKQ